MDSMKAVFLLKGVDPEVADAMMLRVGDLLRAEAFRFATGIADCSEVGFETDIESPIVDSRRKVKRAFVHRGTRY